MLILIYIICGLLFLLTLMALVPKDFDGAVNYAHTKLASARRIIRFEFLFNGIIILLWPFWLIKIVIKITKGYLK